MLRFLAAHLLVGDGDEALLGELPQGVDVRPHVQLAAHQDHFGVGAELLRLPLPLWSQRGQTETSPTDGGLQSDVCSAEGKRLRNVSVQSGNNQSTENEKNMLENNCFIYQARETERFPLFHNVAVNTFRFSLFGQNNLRIQPQAQA